MEKGVKKDFFEELVIRNEGWALEQERPD